MKSENRRHGNGDGLGDPLAAIDPDRNNFHSTPQQLPRGKSQVPPILARHFVRDDEIDDAAGWCRSLALAAAAWLQRRRAA